MDGLRELDLFSLVDRREFLCKRFYNFGSLSNISDLPPKKNLHLYDFRNARNTPLFKTCTSRFYNSYLPTCVRKWDLP